MQLDKLRKSVLRNTPLESLELHGNAEEPMQTKNLQYLHSTAERVTKVNTK